MSKSWGQIHQRGGRRGQPMQLTMAAVAELVACRRASRAWQQNPLGDEPSTAGDGAGEGAGDDKPAEPCTKGRKTHMPPEVKEWFCSLTRVKRDLDHGAVSPLRKRALLSSFEHAHMDTPASGSRRRLPVPLRPLTLPGTRSCPGPWQTLCPASAAECAVAQETLGVSTASPLVSPENSCDHLGTLSRNTRASSGREWPAATTRTLRELCQQKIEWTLIDAAITDRSRIINIDETCCKMLPLLERGWLAGGEQHVVLDTRCDVTVFFATRHLVPDVYAQLIFQGKTSAVETPPTPQSIAADHLSFREPPGRRRRPSQHFLTWLDATVINPDGSRAPWICFMDVCTMHVSQEFLAIRSGPHLARLRAAPQQHGRVPAA